MSKTDVNQSDFLDGIKTNARLAVIVGIIMLVCGFLAIGSLLAAGLSVTIFVGVMLISGVAKEAAGEIPR